MLEHTFEGAQWDVAPAHVSPFAGLGLSRSRLPVGLSTTDRILAVTVATGHVLGVVVGVRDMQNLQLLGAVLRITYANPWPVL